MTGLLFSRRRVIQMCAAAIVSPKVASAAEPRELEWEDLIPTGVPYGEVTGMGEPRNDFMLRFIYDANAAKLNFELDRTEVRIPGYIVPLKLSAKGVDEFLLVPYVGACIHVPPPPPNQIVFVSAKEPWPNDNLWNAVWVTGTLKANLKETDLADIGYEIIGGIVAPYAG